MIETVRRDLTKEELDVLGEQLNTAILEAVGFEAEKKREVDRLNQQIKDVTQKSIDLARKRQQGFEMVEVEVIVAYDEPERGMKQIVEAYTGRVIRAERMLPEEMQERLDFTGESET